MSARPMVGVGVIVIKDNTILLGKRKNAHGEGTWSPPGGHLEFGESPQACAQREVVEETGLCVTNIRFVSFTNDIFMQEDKHYVTLFMLADYQSGTPTVLEPHKCQQWAWFTWQQLPQPLFLPLENLLASLVKHNSDVLFSHLPAKELYQYITR